MKTIHKYTLDVVGERTIQMPENAEFLSVQVQHGEICMWFLVDTGEAEISRKFTVIGTGWEMPNQAVQHLGTVQMEGGSLVWHIFEFTP